MYPWEMSLVKLHVAYHVCKAEQGFFYIRRVGKKKQCYTDLQASLSSCLEKNILNWLKVIKMTSKQNNYLKEAQEQQNRIEFDCPPELKMIYTSPKHKSSEHAKEHVSCIIRPKFSLIQKITPNLQDGLAQNAHTLPGEESAFGDLDLSVSCQSYNVSSCLVYITLHYLSFSQRFYPKRLLINCFQP